MAKAGVESIRQATKTTKEENIFSILLLRHAIVRVSDLDELTERLW